MVIRIIEDRSILWKKFMDNPAKIGSCTPSSHYLAQRLLAPVPWHSINTIVELGAGTGVFTKHIAAHKKYGSTLLIVEQDPLMRSYLELCFPLCHFGSHAENLPYLLRGLGLAHADCILSGLPISIFKAEQRTMIMKRIHSSLSERGIFITFQYSPMMSPLFRHYFRQVHIQFELRNIPPAFLFYCQK